jgi:hypothetical protein
MIDWVLDRPFVMVGIVLLVLGAILYAFIQDQKQWDKFARDHHCVVVARQEGSVATALTTDGKVATVIIPAKVTYHCDDGIDYTREE